MHLNLYSKLLGSFITVIILTAIIAIAAGDYLIGTGIVREAQSKVNLDLNVAWQIYESALDRKSVV
jgi:hypothetical protein